MSLPELKLPGAVIVMAKAPLAGTVKTRLQTFLTAEQCARLAESFLRDTIAKIQNFDEPKIIAYAPPEQRGFFEKFADQRTFLCEQEGGDLGEKISTACELAFRQNFAAAVVIGTDSPTVPTEFIRQAFTFLDEDAAAAAAATAADAVLGKTSDGGFYLIGLRREKFSREIFEKVEWSSARTFRQTARNIERLGLMLKETPAWYDVDEPYDLIKLREELTKNPHRAPRTFEFLTRLDWQSMQS